MAKTKKFSYKRGVILKTIQETKSHPSAEWVYSQVKPQIPNISLGTVYRNIAEFKEDGTITSVGVVNGQERFDADLSPHTHFICDRCGSVIDIEALPENRELKEEIQNKFGHSVKSTNILYKGYCKKLCFTKHC